MLKIRSLTKTFFPGTPNEVRALRGIDLDLADGCFAAIIGTNGSGKSTLLNAVAGTFTPDTGTVELDGHTITDWPEHRRATLVGRVFQNPFAGTAAEMSIAENIVLATRRGQPRGLGFALSHKTRDEIADRIRSLKMGLEDRLENPIGTLSGGQRQALTLLMATLQKPKLLLLDEHTAALDPKTAATVLETTERVVARDNLTTLMITHNMRDAIAHGNRLIMMYEGRIAIDVSGEAKKSLTVEKLLEQFEKISGSQEADDKLLLS